MKLDKPPEGYGVSYSRVLRKTLATGTKKKPGQHKAVGQVSETCRRQKSLDRGGHEPGRAHKGSSAET